MVTPKGVTLEEPKSKDEAKKPDMTDLKQSAKDCEESTSKLIGDTKSEDTKSQAKAEESNEASPKMVTKADKEPSKADDEVNKLHNNK